MSKRIFISKNASEIELYQSQLVDLGYTVEAHSFLSFSPVSFEIQQAYDVIFFGSPRAVIFFRAARSIPENVQIACIGDKTADLLASLGYNVAFHGEKSGEPKVVATTFKNWLGTKNVFFPLSDRSLKSIASEIPVEQKEEVIVYSTEVASTRIDACEMYVFTSPSNVEGFFKGNVISDGAKVIAWGESTKAALISRAASVHYCLKNSSFEELLSYLQAI